MESHFPKSKKTIASHERRKNKKVKYVIVSINIVPVDGEDTFFIKLQNVDTGLYLIRTPREIVINPSILYSLSDKEMVHMSYLAGYEHNARGACIIDGDDDCDE